MNLDKKPPIDESTWRNRFIIINLVRIAGTVQVQGAGETDFFSVVGDHIDTAS